MIYVAISVIGLFLNISWAGEIADSKANTSSRNVAVPARNAKYLGCVNQLDRIANGVNLNPNDGDFDPSQNPSIFLTKRNGKIGVMTVMPDSSTFEEVPISPEKDVSPGRYVFMNDARGKRHYFRLYTDINDDMINAASSWDEDSPTDMTGDTFHEIAKPDKSIDFSSATDSIARETVRRMDTIPARKKSAEEFAKLKKRPLSWSEDEAIGILCGCIKTENTLIVEGAKKAAAAVGIPEEKIKTCYSPLVSRVWLRNLWREILGEAHAMEKSLPAVWLKANSSLGLVSITDSRALFCRNQKMWSVDFKTGAIRDGKKKCIDTPYLLLTSNKMRASLERQNAILFEPLKSK